PSTGPRRPAAGSGSGPPGWSRSPSARSPRSSTWWRPSTGRSGRSCSPSWSPTRLSRASCATPTPGSPRCWNGRCSRWSTTSAAAAPCRVDVDTTAIEDRASTTVVCRLEPGHRLRLVKYLAYGWSSVRSRPALVDQVLGALTGARYSGFEGLLAEQRAYLDGFWDAGDVEVEGDAELQQAVRFGMFHVLQAGARTERR